MIPMHSSNRSVLGKNFAHCSVNNNYRSKRSVLNELCLLQILEELLAKITSTVRETVFSRPNVSTIKGPPSTPQYVSAVIVLGTPQWGPHDADRSQFQGQLNTSDRCCFSRLV